MSLSNHASRHELSAPYIYRIRVLARNTLNSGLAPAKLNEIANRVWSMVLGLKLKPTSLNRRPSADLSFVLGTVRISGAWQGELTLGCSAELARKVAAAMFGKSPEQAEPEEIRDAIGELTNMVGGNFKTILKGECRLSVPSIVDPVLLARFEPTSEKHQWFECEGSVVFLGILRQGLDS